MEEGSLTRDFEKTLEMDVSLCRGPVREPEGRGPFTGNFEG
jgi:hypothetical protein